MNDAIGYASGAGELTTDTRKSVFAGSFDATPAAAAVTDSIVGSMNLPAAFLSDAKGTLFSLAYASST